MTQETWDAVDAYISQQLVGPDPALDATLSDSAAAGLPAIAVAPNQGKLLHLLARILGAQRILEIGTLGGYSTIWLARALPEGGRMISLEAVPKHAEVARANLARAGLAELVQVRVGSAIETLPQLEAEGVGPFDLSFIDADKPTTPEYFQWSLRLSHPGSVIIVDNTVRDGSVLDAASEDPSTRGIRRLNEVIAAEPRVTATAIQTVGVKGYDGLTIALVTG